MAYPTYFFLKITTHILIIADSIAFAGLAKFDTRCARTMTREAIIRARAKERQGMRSDLTSSSSGEEVKQEGGTDARLARISGAGKGTIHRVRTIERSAPPEAKEALAKGTRHNVCNQTR
jgi:hypothetical protein